VDSLHSGQIVELLRRPQLHTTSREPTDPCAMYRLDSRLATLATSRKLESSDTCSQQFDTLLLPHYKARNITRESPRRSLWFDRQRDVGQRSESSFRPQVRRNLAFDPDFPLLTPSSSSSDSLKLESWMSKLPDSLRVPPQLTKPPPGHVILLNALYHFVVILLYRPYYNLQGNSLPIHEISVKRCNAASSRIISLFEVRSQRLFRFEVESCDELIGLIQLFEQAPGLRYAPVTMTQICFAAGTTQLLASVNSNGKKATDAKEAARRCVSALKEMGRAFECATQTGKILERLVDQWAPKDSPMSDSAANEGLTSTSISPHQQLLDPESELAKQLVSMGWQPPPSVPQASTSALPAAQVCSTILAFPSTPKADEFRARAARHLPFASSKSSLPSKWFRIRFLSSRSSLSAPTASPMRSHLQPLTAISAAATDSAIRSDEFMDSSKSQPWS